MEDSNGGGSVRISNRQIYDLLLDTRERVMKLENTVPPEQEDLKKRVSTLELRIYSIMAGLIAAGVGAHNLGII